MKKLAGKSLMAILLSLILSMSLFVGCEKGGQAKFNGTDATESVVAVETSADKTTKDDNKAESSFEIKSSDSLTEGEGQTAAKGEGSDSEESKDSGNTAEVNPGGSGNSGSSGGDGGSVSSGSSGNSGNSGNSGSNNSSTTVPETQAPTQVETEAVKPTAAVVPPTQAEVQEVDSSGIKLVTFTSFTDSEKSTAQQIVNSKINASMSEYDKVKTIHDYLVNHIRYTDEANITDDVSNSIYHASGAFAGNAVCQGYADAFNILCYYAGIQTECVASEAMRHAWNQVRIDGVWYNIDVTWDDPVMSDGSDARTYSYFLLSDTDMGADHYGGVTNEQHVCPTTYLTKSGNDELSAVVFAESRYPGYVIVRITSVDEISTKTAAYTGSKVAIIFTSSVDISEVGQKVCEIFGGSRYPYYSKPFSTDTFYVMPCN